jgi:hypothetical protein
MTKESRNPFERGPYVQMALFCERVLREGDGVFSVIRIVDQINHTERGVSPPEDMPEVHFPLELILSLKAGSARGRSEIKIIPEQPSGETLPPLTMSVILEGENKGAVIHSRIDIPYKYEGLYWFRVEFDGNVITRLPLEVRYSRMVIAGPRNPNE